MVVAFDTPAAALASLESTGWRVAPVGDRWMKSERGALLVARVETRADGRAAVVIAA